MYHDHVHVKSQPSVHNVIRRLWSALKHTSRCLSFPAWNIQAEAICLSITSIFHVSTARPQIAWHSTASHVSAQHRAKSGHREHGDKGTQERCYYWIKANKWYRHLQQEKTTSHNNSSVSSEGQTASGVDVWEKAIMFSSARLQQIFSIDVRGRLSMELLELHDCDSPWSFVYWNPLDSSNLPPEVKKQKLSSFP